ncbi:MAG: hypothetical protein HZA28_00930 [Candidatus Omnitrophica bacterium]|nr:hypothetical protein [Candidatus Omnitrophota bacterium]
MKKLTYTITVILAVCLSAPFAFAEGMKGAMKEGGMEGKGMMMGKGMMGKGMMEDGMMDDGMMKMMKMMHAHSAMMRSPTMVASNDGGVIVLTGNKLSKYDKNLNLVKEAEIKTEMGGMGGMMGGMGGKKMCPMCAGMKGKGDTADQAPKEEAGQPAKEDSEHKSHH